MKAPRHTTKFPKYICYYTSNPNTHTYNRQPDTLQYEVESKERNSTYFGMYAIQKSKRITDYQVGYDSFREQHHTVFVGVGDTLHKVGSTQYGYVQARYLAQTVKQKSSYRQK